MLRRLRPLTGDDQSCETGRHITNWATFLSCWRPKLDSGDYRGRILGFFLNHLLPQWNIGRRHLFGLLFTCFWRLIVKNLSTLLTGSWVHETLDGLWLINETKTKTTLQTELVATVERPTGGHVHGLPCLGLYTTFTTRRKQTCCPLNTK